MNIQREVTNWANKTFPDSSVEAKVLHLMEELQEAFAASDEAEVREEIADCGLITLHLASSLNVKILFIDHDFQKEMFRKLEICKNRTWKKPDENGVVRHVKT